MSATDLLKRARSSASSTRSWLKGHGASALLSEGAGGSPGGSPPAPYRSEQPRSSEMFFWCVEGMGLHSLPPYTDLVTFPSSGRPYRSSPCRRTSLHPPDRSPGRPNIKPDRSYSSQRPSTS